MPARRGDCCPDAQGMKLCLSSSRWPGYRRIMSLDQIAPVALRLPPKERALLAASLWESIEDPYALTIDQSDEDAVALALARDAEMESGKVTPLSHSELMTRLRG